MAFRQTYSRVENSEQARADFSLDMALIINGFRFGRVQGISHSMQASPRRVTELGSDRAVEIVPGIKQYQGRIQSLALQYGALPKRLASVIGAVIDASSEAATLTNFPEFDIVIARRGSAGQPAPTLNAPAQGPLDLAGTGGVIMTMIGCAIESYERSINANETLIMESCSIQFIDLVQGG
jgi:hypothetical protein